ncbi:MAG: antibiotic biosynthesis monooxygenase [Henriciella sp.]|nr:antibiotic biosynthesis monooxygenase [Henriciella sp.]
MTQEEFDNGPILRLFQVQTKPGRAQDLLEKFATTSIQVVQGEPGNQGCFFGRGTVTDEDYVVFASIWQDMDAVRARFGEDWQVSFLPPGYSDLIEDCSVRHIELSAGWHVNLGGSR